MLSSIIAALAPYFTQIIIGLVSALGGWIAKVIHNWVLKRQAEKETQQAVDNASKNNDTSGIFK